MKSVKDIPNCKYYKWSLKRNKCLNKERETIIGLALIRNNGCPFRQFCKFYEEV